MRPARRSSSMAQPIGSMTGRGKKMDRATRPPRTQKGSNECSSQDRISWSPTFVAIRFQQLLASLRSDFSLLKKWFNEPQRAHPPAEKSSAKHCGNEDRQAPEQAASESSLKERPDRIG